MANDYATLLLALLMAYQMSAPYWDGRPRRGAQVTVILSLSLAAVFLVPWLSFTGLRLGWGVSGVLLMGYAWRAMQAQARTRSVWLTALDGAGGWVALILAGASPLAAAAGGLAGLALPLALGPWPSWLRQIAEPLEVLLMGSVGLRALLKAGVGAGPAAWPLLVFAVPWLILWDWRVGGAAT